MQRNFTQRRNLRSERRKRGVYAWDTLLQRYLYLLRAVKCFRLNDHRVVRWVLFYGFGSKNFIVSFYKRNNTCVCGHLIVGVTCSSLLRGKSFSPVVCRFYWILVNFPIQQSCKSVTTSKILMTLPRSRTRLKNSRNSIVPSFQGKTRFQLLPPSSKQIDIRQEAFAN